MSLGRLPQVSCTYSFIGTVELKSALKHEIDTAFKVLSPIVGLARGALFNATVCEEECAVVFLETAHGCVEIFTGTSLKAYVFITIEWGAVMQWHNQPCRQAQTREKVIAWMQRASNSTEHMVMG